MRTTSGRPHLGLAGLDFGYTPGQSCKTRHETGDMEHDQEADTWPLDALYGTALVVRIMRDMDEDNHGRCEVLLSDLVCAAWPSPATRDQ